MPQQEGLPRPRAIQTVMIVDDDPDIREVLAEVLASEGFRVKTAGNGFEALQALRGRELPCMILLDLMMPLMDGYEFLEVRRKNPCLHAIPVALVTASEHLDRSRIQGVPVVRKPIPLSKLLDMVGRNC